MPTQGKGNLIDWSNSQGSEQTEPKKAILAASHWPNTSLLQSSMASIQTNRLSGSKHAAPIGTPNREKDAPDPKWLENLRERLAREPLFIAADDAFSRLTKKGCETHITLAYLNRVVGYKSGNLGARLYRKARPNKLRRDIRGIGRQLEKAAKRIEKLRSMWWGMYGRVVNAGCFHFPEELKQMAQRLSRIDLKGYGEWNPQRDAVLDLLDHVRSSTGRYHYAEVSTLINARLTRQALEQQRPIPDLKYDIDSLKMLIQRSKREREAMDARWHRAYAAPQVERNDIPLANSPVI